MRSALVDPVTTSVPAGRLAGVVVLGAALLFPPAAPSQEYSYDSHQITNQHRVQEGAVGGFWGHHLGHMVRTGRQGLWYVDDTGSDVNINPYLNYHRFDGTRWVLMRSLANPATIQQNTATVAIGDSLFTYGVNINGGYIEEAACDTRTSSAVYNRRIRYIGPGTNYIGAAVSPNGTRVVWWTRVVNFGGPSDWVYMYNRGDGWSASIVSQIPGNDFSYVFASFLNDSVFYVGGEVPKGSPPTWTYEAGAGMVVLGQALQDFTIMKGDNIGAHDIWVNRSNGDVHFLVYGSYGSPGYFYKPAGGVWTDTLNYVDIGGVGRSRLIDSPDGNLYYIISQNGFRMMVIPKASITGLIDFSPYPLVPLGTYDGYQASYAIWPEVKEFQTAPVGGINFAYPGNDYDFAPMLRHTSVEENPGTVLLRVSFPNGQEVFQGNTDQTIYWYRPQGSGIDSVSIDFSSNGGSTWVSVAGRAPNRGWYPWRLPAISSPTCLFRVSAAGGGAPSDVSDGAFVIQYTPPVYRPPTSSITRPTRDTTVEAGRIMVFEGTAIDTDGYIVNYQWKTGDGRVVKGIVKRFEHTYAAAGTYIATLEAQDNDTLWSAPDSVRITVLPSTGIETAAGVPVEYELLPAYPNPFNAGTVLTYTLNRTMHVRLRVFGLGGEEVARLADGVEPAGVHTMSWDGTNGRGRALSSGFYLVRLESPVGIRVQKLLLLR